MSAMLKITLPDGSVREVAPGTTPADIAAAIGPGLAKAAIAARVDGELRDIMRPLEQDAALALVTAKDEADALELARHDFAHVLAEAVQHLFPGTQITFGPSTDDGFYYDFYREEPSSTDDFAAIEKEMARIVDRDAKFEREVWDRDEAIVFFEARGQAWALSHLLRAIEVDFADVLAKKNATISVRQIIRELEAAQEPLWSPMVLNGSGYGVLANHSLVMANYISRANAGMIDLRQLLSQG